MAGAPETTGLRVVVVACHRRLVNGAKQVEPI